jgi:hypothetical protein
MTTQWQSIFDSSSTGKCEVVVYSDAGDAPEDGNVVYDGLLGKGDTSDAFTGQGGDSYTVSVDADGVVSLNSDSGGSFGMAVEVSPGDLAVGTHSRIIDMNVSDGGGGGSHPGVAYCWADHADNATTVNVDFSAQPADPTEADFDVVGFLGVQVEAVG